MPRRRATLRSRWWKDFYQSIAHCYSCGKKLQRRHIPAEGVKRHICPDCSTITYLNPKIVTGLIPMTADGRIALLRRNIEPAYGKWSYPAGYMELGETVEEAAARETREEINAKVKVTHFLGNYSYRDAGVVTMVFVGQLPKKKQPSAGQEALEVKLFKPSEIPWKDLAFRSTTHALKDWKKMLKRFL